MREGTHCSLRENPEPLVSDTCRRYPAHWGNWWSTSTLRPLSSERCDRCLMSYRVCMIFLVCVQLCAVVSSCRGFGHLTWRICMCPETKKVRTFILAWYRSLFIREPCLVLRAMISELQKQKAQNLATVLLLVEPRRTPVRSGARLRSRARATCLTLAGRPSRPSLPGRHGPADQPMRLTGPIGPTQPGRPTRSTRMNSVCNRTTRNTKVSCITVSSFCMYRCIMWAAPHECWLFFLLRCSLLLQHVQPSCFAWPGARVHVRAFSEEFSSSLM